MAKDYKQLTIRDSFMFGKITMDHILSQEFISALMNKQIEVQDMPQREKFIQLKVDGKYVKLDMYLVDKCNRIIDTEMQNKSKNSKVQENLPVRSRVYQSMIDYEILDSGAFYRDVKECIVVFICTYDLYGKGSYIYTFKNTCQEFPDIILDDKSTKIFFNTTADLSFAPESTRNLLSYIESGKVSDELTKKIEEAVQAAKENEEWGHEYMLTFVHDCDVREEGRLEGRLEGRTEGQFILTEVIKKLKEGKTESELIMEGYDMQTVELAKTVL